jgi:dTDP-4-dehydrorhamnose 3,5-epimerase
MPYTVHTTAIDGVLMLEPKVFGDARGFFFESFNARDFAAATGVDLPFVQDNHSRSAQGVLRGLHYQVQHPQGKLVRVTEGEVFDVVVDIRPGSPTRVSGWASVCPPTTSAKCGCPLGWPMAFWC